MTLRLRSAAIIVPMINSISPRVRLAAVAAVCATAGVAAGTIADAGASAPATKKSNHAKTVHTGRRLLRYGLGQRRLAELSHTVAGSFVVDTKDGFVTVSVARGAVNSVSGDQLTIDEGTLKQTYKTVTLTLPSNTLVRNQHQKSALSSLTKGERVVVIDGPKRALVVAGTTKSA
jgi:hypothetical protein